MPLSCLLLLYPLFAWSALAAVEPATDPGWARAHALTQTYCFQCHSGTSVKGGLDLGAYRDEAAFRADPGLIERMLVAVRDGDMPTRKAEKPLPDAERAQLLAWYQGIIASLAAARPDDPGLVVAPRLNQQEYDLVIRDLTGLDLGYGGSLAPDSGAGEGFINVGAAQPMGVGQFEGFLAVSKQVLGHARIVPGLPIAWSASPVLPTTSTQDLSRAIHGEWKSAVGGTLARVLPAHEQALREAWKADAAAAKIKVSGVLSAYAEACWRYRYRAQLGRPQATLQDTADAYEVPLYRGALQRLWNVLNADESDAEVKGLMETVFAREMASQWQALPPPVAGSATSARSAILRIQAYIQDHGETARWRVVRPPFEVAPVDYTASQTEYGQNADGRAPFAIDAAKVPGGELLLVVGNAGDGSDGDVVRITAGTVTAAGGSRPLAEVVPRLGEQAWRQGVIEVQAPTILRLPVPAGAQRITFEASLDPTVGRQATVQVVVAAGTAPDPQTFLTGRRILGSEKFPRAKNLNAAVSRLGGYFHSNGASKVASKAMPGLTDDQIRQLGLTQVRDDRPHPNFLLSITVADLLSRLPEADLMALDQHRQRLLATLTPLPQRAAAAQVLEPFATQAWRRAPSAAELESLLAFYDHEIAAGANHENAVKEPLMAILVSPHFLYRLNRASGATTPTPLSGPELATRLAFTLWGSLPDEALRAAGASGALLRDDTLRAQIARMRADPRGAGLATQFAAHWLQFADLPGALQPDGERFKNVDEALKQAMRDELVLFFDDLFRENRPVTNVIRCDYTYLNEALAKHYGIAGVTGPQMRRVTIDPAQRGGVLAMAGVLTRVSKPLRTSPVRRGAWVYEYVLGLHLPAPPPNVPLISDDERDAKGQSVRMQLQRHRADPACMACHEKIDPLGIALERFDAVGRWREKDLAGEAVDDQGSTTDGGLRIDGFEGLRRHLESQRPQFLRGFCTKLLGYCLGREVLPSDQALIARMIAALDGGDYRPGAALDLVLISQQFRMRRDGR